MDLNLSCPAVSQICNCVENDMQIKSYMPIKMDVVPMNISE